MTSSSPSFAAILIVSAALALLTINDVAPPKRRQHENPNIERNVAKTIADVESRRDYQLAIFVQVSNKTLAHLPRLLHRIWHEGNLYAIHFDVPIDQNFAKDALLAANLPAKDGVPVPVNVLTMPQEIINYRGVSMLLNTISAMQFLLDASTSWRYFINLSASDYPLISQNLLRKLLRHEGPSRNFFSFAAPESAAKMLHNRMAEFHVDDALSFRQRKRPVETVHARNPVATQLQFSASHAESWMINSRSFCNFVVTSPVARKTLLSFAYSLSSPEHYFASLVRNDPVQNATVIPHCMRLILWKFKGQRANQHPFYLDDLPGIEEIIIKSPLFFARKFRHPNSPLMDLVDSHSQDPDHERAVRNHYYNKIGMKKMVK